MWLCLATMAGLPCAPPGGRNPRSGPTSAPITTTMALLAVGRAGAGVARLAQAARELTETHGPPPLTRARHRAALRSASAHLEAAELADLPELRGEDLRLAMR